MVGGIPSWSFPDASPRLPSSHRSPWDCCQPASLGPTLFSSSLKALSLAKEGVKKRVGAGRCTNTRLSSAGTPAHTHTRKNIITDTFVYYYVYYCPPPKHTLTHSNYSDAAAAPPPVTQRQLPWLQVWPRLAARTTSPRVPSVSVPLSTSQPISIAPHESSSPAHFIVSSPSGSCACRTSHFLLKMRERGEEGDGKVGGEGGRGALQAAGSQLLHPSGISLQCKFNPMRL